MRIVVFMFSTLQGPQGVARENIRQRRFVLHHALQQRLQPRAKTNALKVGAFPVPAWTVRPEEKLFRMTSEETRRKLLIARQSVVSTLRRQVGVEVGVVAQQLNHFELGETGNVIYIIETVCQRELHYLWPGTVYG